MLILAIESSCDENSVAVLRDGALLSVCTRTQTVHQQFGGVVPELAGRSHLELVDPLTAEAMQTAGVTLAELDLVVSTVGPGLVGSLLVGASYARGLALALGIPFRAMHHVEAHLWSAELTVGPLPLPFLVLLVSGGHTLLVRVDGLRQYHILGTTLDDALGEAYDKVGKLVGLSFPAGAEVDRLAAQGNPAAYRFPISLPDDPFNFSFSGLKTAVLYKLRGLDAAALPPLLPDLLASFQEAALESVLLKVRHAVTVTMPRALIAAGGVAANSALRAKLQKLAKQSGIPAYFPALQYCGDNAAMIGYLGGKLERAGIASEADAVVRPRWSLSALATGESRP